jgi:DNA polymerase-3 subunit alpha
MQRHRTLFVEGAVKNDVSAIVAEQLFDQMVLFAEYCFNKSHSTAYGAVTYQTAYLKAHYPTAYMAALLTVNAGSADKVQRYISNCNSMGINVMPPNINTSGVDFTPKDNSILFGFSAVKNLGDGAIRTIITSRDKDGEFTSLAEFCDRISLSAINRRGLEALIHSGALDCLEKNANRAQLIADLDLTIEWASSRAKDRISGQGNLFDLFSSINNESSSTDDYSSAPKAKPVNEYPPSVKLKLEKEHVGFYLSDHPLKQLSEPAKLIAPISLGSLEEQKDKSKVSVIGMIPEMREVTTRKGDRMAIIQLEDLTGSCEAVVFPKSYERLSDHLMIETRLLIWGSVDRRDETVQLIVDDCREIDDLRFLLIDLPPEQATDINVQHKLRECLSNNRPARNELGVRIPVVACLKDKNNTRYVRLGDQFCVKDTDLALDSLSKNSFTARTSQRLVN